MSKNVVIVSYARTPLGSFKGALSTVSAPQLGATAIKGALEKCNLDANHVDEVIMGCVLPAGLGQAPARQAAIYAGIPNDVETLTINKMCGSGLKAIMQGQQSILAGDSDVVVAGGMENMSQSPHYLMGSRDGIRLGNGKLVDGMIHDGLWDVYNNQHMGNCAEICAKEYEFSREDQDNFAERSYTRSQDAISNGLYENEIVSVSVPQRRGEPIIVSADEEPNRVNFDKMRALRPAFDKEGSVTAGNASTINDGAAALILMSEDKAKELGLTPIAKIVSQASAAHAPEWFTTAPVKAMNKAVEKAGLSMDDIDLFEINEAFAVVTMAAEKDLSLDSEKVNVLGGAVSMGHPIGASGARIMCTLLNAMNQKNVNRGMASICIGGGEASAVIVEML
ncbi:MAG: acetyl-CoA C-acetyltransferase [Candidatus Marinimicrobia bacterium]|nr:acetyl-CoA C-acetyltransferase [Candidatus Neomarinimicrobiota bacterium]